MEVVENDLCIACGACVDICPAGAIEPTFNRERGSFEVAVVNSDACNACDAPCTTVCPSVEVDFAELGGWPTRPDRLGPISSVQLGYAPEYQNNGVSSSGGVLRLILSDALERGVPVICLAEDEESEGEYEARLLRSIGDVPRVPGSIYHSISFFRAISLLREADQPCVLVAIPCHLEGILAYIRKSEPELLDKIELAAGIICGWMFSHHGIKAFAEYNNVSEPIIDVRYRGEDRVGKLKLRTAVATYRFDRRRFDAVREALNYKACFGSEVNRLRCRVCQDHTNILADVAVGDAWVDRVGTRKISIVVARSERGERMLQRLKAEGRLVTEQGSVDDIYVSQSEALVDGTAARKLATFLSKRGVATTHFRYSDESNSLPYDATEARRFWFERIGRAILRREWYKAYRVFYLATRWRMFLQMTMRNAFRKPS